MQTFSSTDSINVKAGDMTIKGSSDELATEMQLREEKTCQTADESKREISIALKMWKETLEAENKKEDSGILRLPL
ncbi:hypothetical protein RB195_018649 [Necator americanus]|uniref:Uncharacterized protein n=1 Tax=Necator americanus TaxID=51031 RepID=A0ABR1CCK7_NECAM